MYLTIYSHLYCTLNDFKDFTYLLKNLDTLIYFSLNFAYKILYRLGVKVRQPNDDFFSVRLSDASKVHSLLSYFNRKMINTILNESDDE